MKKSRLTQLPSLAKRRTDDIEAQAKCWRYLLKRVRSIFPDEFPNDDDETLWAICERIESLADEVEILMDENTERAIEDDLEETAAMLAHDEHCSHHRLTWH